MNNSELNFRSQKSTLATLTINLLLRNTKGATHKVQCLNRLWRAHKTHAQDVQVRQYMNGSKLIKNTLL